MLLRKKKKKAVSKGDGEGSSHPSLLAAVSGQRQELLGLMCTCLVRCAHTGTSAARPRSSQRQQRRSLGPGGSRASVGISHAARLGHAVDGTSRITGVGKCPRKSCVNRSSCCNNTAVLPAQHPAAEGEPDGVLLTLPCHEGTARNDIRSLHSKKPKPCFSLYRCCACGLEQHGWNEQPSCR